MPDNLNVAMFMNLFKGHDHAYGKHVYKFTETGKEQGDNSTVKGTMIKGENYVRHLSGEVGLGVIPINEDNKVRFTAIDIDIYNDHDIMMFVDTIDRNDIPCIPFRSKSGGLHIFIFFKEFESAHSAIDVTRKLASVMGIDNYVKRAVNRIYEVFPKQTKLASGAVGNWINLPYYHAKETKQYAYHQGSSLRLDEFLTLAQRRMTSVEDVKTFIQDIPYSDAPPCLQTLNFINPFSAESNRNEFLFSFGVYLKKKDEEFFEQQLFEVNSNLRQPLPSNELEATLLSSLRKRDYTYKCSTPPLCDYCNRGVCQTREYGVGKADGYFSTLDYGRLRQINTSDPYYEWDIRIQGNDSWKSLRFKNEDEIIQQNAFLSKCFRELHTLPPKLKQTQWFKIVNQSLQGIEVTLVEEADDMSPLSIFKNYLFDFLFNRARAATLGQIMLKRAFKHEDRKVFYFRPKDFLEYLYMQRGFKHFSAQEVHGILTDLRVKFTRVRIGGDKQIRVVALPFTSIKNMQEEDSNTHEAEENFEPDFEQFDEEPF